jgi:glycerol uptake facilitator-like aquaporin
MPHAICTIRNGWKPCAAIEIIAVGVVITFVPFALAFVSTHHAVFVLANLCVTATGSPSGSFAPIAIGLTLRCACRCSPPVSNACINPARSVATAIFGSLWRSARSGCSSSLRSLGRASPALLPDSSLPAHTTQNESQSGASHEF